MTTALRTALVIPVLLFVLAAGPYASDWLSVPAGANEHVSLAASGQTVAAVWTVTPDNGETAVYAAISRDAARTFSEPVRVATGASVSSEQPPRALLIPASRTSPAGTAGTDLVVVWPAKTAAGTRLLSSRSRDFGRSFSTPSPIGGTAAPGNRGWHSLAADASGHPIVLWLDHREGAAAAGAHHHAAAEDAAAAEASVARAATSRLYVGSADGSIPAQGLVHGVCYCCKTALATAPNGDLVAAWRHVYPGGYRDMAFSRSADGGRTFSTPVRVSQDGWQIAGCPEDGPALAVDRQGRTHIVWPTLVRENGRETMALFHAMSADGRTFSPRARIATGDAAFHPQLVVTSDGQLVVAWDEGRSGTRQVRMARATVDASGAATFAPDANFREAGDNPAIAAIPDGIVMAWPSRTGTATGIRLVRRAFR